MKPLKEWTVVVRCPDYLDFETYVAWETAKTALGAQVKVTQALAKRHGHPRVDFVVVAVFPGHLIDHAT
jgi:hypothetical protein